MLPSQTFLRRFEPTVASAPTRSGLPYGKSDGKTSDQAFLNRAMVEAKSKRCCQAAALSAADT